MLEFAFTSTLLLLSALGVMDIGRYCLTVVSLQTLAGQAARSIVLNCSGPLSPSCASIGLTTTEQRSLTPFLFVGTETPTLAAAASAGIITVTASLPTFTFFMPLLAPLTGAVSEQTKLYY